MSQSASGEEEEMEMDYDQAVEKLNNMFPHISRAQIIDELTKADDNFYDCVDSLILIKAPGSGHHEDLSDNEVEHPRLQSSGRLENPVTLTDDKLKLREPLSSGVGSKDFIDKVVDNDQEDTEDYEEIPHEMLVSENDIERARKQFFGSEYEQVMRTREEKGVIYESVYIQNPEPPKSMKLLTRAGSSSCPSKISNITFGLSNKGSSRYTKDIVYIELVHQNEKEKADREAAVELQEKYLAEAEE